MSNNDFESKLAEYEGLRLLINEEKLDHFTKLPSLDEFNTDFIEWISPKFYYSFITLYQKEGDSHFSSKLSSLLKSEWICNIETKEKLLLFITKRLTDSLKEFEQKKPKLKKHENKSAVITKVNKLIRKHLLNDSHLYIFKNLKTPEIKELEHQYTEESLLVADDLAFTKASKKTDFKVFTDLLSQIEQLDLNEEQARMLHSLKQEKRSSKHINIAIGILMGLFIVRQLFRLL